MPMAWINSKQDKLSPAAASATWAMPSDAPPAPT